MSPTLFLLLHCPPPPVRRTLSCTPPLKTHSSSSSSSNFFFFFVRKLIRTTLLRFPRRTALCVKQVPSRCEQGSRCVEPRRKKNPCHTSSPSISHPPIAFIWGVNLLLFYLFFRGKSFAFIRRPGGKRVGSEAEFCRVFTPGVQKLSLLNSRRFSFFFLKYFFQQQKKKSCAEICPGFSELISAEFSRRSVAFRSQLFSPSHRFG